MTRIKSFSLKNVDIELLRDEDETYVVRSSKNGEPVSESDPFISYAGACALFDEVVQKLQPTVH